MLTAIIYDESTTDLQPMLRACGELRVGAHVHGRVRAFSTTMATSAGHSKWANIKHDKARNDMQKNKVANKFANAIAVAAKLGGPDPSKNVRLATTVEAASKANVLKKVIENAIRRGAGIASGSEKDNVETAVYEGVGPGNVAFVVEALTDNKKRTFSDVRALFTKHGGNLTPTLFQFERKGYIIIDPQSRTFDEVFDTVAEMGAEDLEEIEGDEEDAKAMEVFTDAGDTGRVATELKKMEFKIQEVGIAYVAKEDSTVTIEEQDIREKYDKFVGLLDDLDDVTGYYSTLKE